MFTCVRPDLTIMVLNYAVTDRETQTTAFLTLACSIEGFKKTFYLMLVCAGAVINDPAYQLWFIVINTQRDPNGFMLGAEMNRIQQQIDNDLVYL